MLWDGREVAQPEPWSVSLHSPQRGINAFWVLLSDSIAGCLIMLSLTGLLLWTQLHTVRTLALLVSVGALFLGLLSILHALA